MSKDTNLFFIPDGTVVTFEYVNSELEKHVMTGMLSNEEWWKSAKDDKTIFGSMVLMNIQINGEPFQ